MSSQPAPAKVSFIVPVRNRAALLRTALASCVSQSIESWEAIILDDHSDEDIEGVVASFNDSRIRYQRQDSGCSGVAAAREAAIQVAHSDVFITLDADDINHPHRAHRCAELLALTCPRLIYTRVRFFDHKTGSNRPKPVFQPFCAQLFRYFNFITNPGTAFNRSAYEAAGGYYDHHLCVAEDYDLYLRMSKAGVQILGLDEEHVSYRKGSGSTTEGQRETIQKALESIRAKHVLPPFSFESVMQLYALPELAQTMLDNPITKALWSDDRWQPDI